MEGAFREERPGVAQEGVAGSEATLRSEEIDDHEVVVVAVDELGGFDEEPVVVIEEPGYPVEAALSGRGEIEFLREGAGIRILEGPVHSRQVKAVASIGIAVVSRRVVLVARDRLERRPAPVPLEL